jgi:5-methyltetrahydropteroyltriglutamate--homocysteine methyltransferase
VKRRRFFLTQHAPGPFNITLASPAYVVHPSYRCGLSDQPYPDRALLLRGIIDIVRNEMRALVKDGVSCIQLDERFAYHMAQGGIAADAEKQLAADIAAENESCDVVRSDAVTVAMHVCRGSRVAWHHGPGHYDWLAERLFDGLRVRSPPARV